MSESPLLRYKDEAEYWQEECAQIDHRNKQLTAELEQLRARVPQVTIVFEGVVDEERGAQIADSIRAAFTEASLDQAATIRDLRGQLADANAGGVSQQAVIRDLHAESDRLALENVKLTASVRDLSEQVSRSEAARLQAASDSQLLAAELAGLRTALRDLAGDTP